MVILQNKQKLILSFFFIPAFLAVSFFFTHAQTAPVPTLKKLDVSAYIISSKNKSVPNGVHQVRFAIYKKDRTVPDPYPSSSDSSIWEETQDIDFKDGILRAQLGENKAFPATLNFNDDEYYLGIRIDTDSEMVPRKRLGAVALSISTLNLEGHVTGENAGNIPVLDGSGQLLETMIPEVTEVGTISTGTWEADVIESGYIAKALTGKTYNGLTISTSGNSFSIYKSAGNKLTMTNGVLSLSTMGAAGSVVYSNGTSFAFSSQGTAGQVLYSTGSGAPAWGSLSGGSVTPDSLDMTEMADTLTLDADLIINPSASNYSLNLDAGTLFADTANNRIGIGTTSSSYKLDVQGGYVNASSGLCINGDCQTTWNNIILPTGTNGQTLYNNAGTWTATSNLYHDGTNVGIGTTNPNHKLTIQNSVAQSLINLDSSNITNGYSRITYTTDGTDWIVGAYNTSGAERFAISNNLLGWSNEILVIDDGGNIGIGTTNPAQKLDVSGKIALNGTTIAYLPTSVTGTLILGNGGANLLSGADYNTFVGLNSGVANTTGYSNTAVGYNSFYSNTTGYRNAALGYNSLYSNTTGRDNAAVGYNSLYSNTQGRYNSAFGFESLYSNVVGFYNSAFGTISLRANTGDYNSAFGYGSLTTNTSGSYNSAFGYVSLYFNTTGNENSAFGYNSLLQNTTGSYNSTFGYNSLGLNTTGHDNSAFGHNSLSDNTTGNYNSAFGMNAGINNQTGSGNLFLGHSAGYGTANYTGSDYNTIIGYQAGLQLGSDQDYNVFIGYQAGYSETGSNKLIIANSSTSSLVYGDLSTGMIGIGGTAASTSPYVLVSFSGNVGIGTTNPSSKLDIFASSGNLLNLANSTSSVFTVLNNGNVGIGTTNPTEKLYVSGTRASEPSVMIRQNDSGSTYGVNLGIDSEDYGFLKATGSSNIPMAFFTGNDEVFRYTTSGNVGIGTTAPGYKLDVQGGYVNASSGLCINGSCQTTWNNIILPTGINGQTLYNSSGTWTATSNLYNNGTNVGIGTTSPGTKIDVSGAIRVTSGTLTLTDSYGAGLFLDSNDYGVSGRFTYNSNPYYRNLIKADSNNGIYIGNNSAAIQGITFDAGNNHTNSLFKFNIEGNEVVRIDHSGNVGIGTTNPTSLFYIAATNPEISIRSNNSSTGTAALNLFYGLAGDITKNTSGFKLSYDVNSAITYFDSKYQHSAGQQWGDMQFRTAPVTGGVMVPALTIQSSGNVGIGTTNPLYKLDVQSGYVNASSGLCINGSCQTTWNNIVLPTGTNGQTLYNSSGTWTATSNLFNNGTNVGIGTTNSQSILNVNGGVGSLATGISFGDGDTGLYESTDDLLLLSVGTNIRMRIQTSGLDLYNNTGPMLYYATASTTTPTILPYSADTNTGLGASGNDILSLIAGGTNGLNVISSGNVGIGTTNPLAKLHIEGTSGYPGIVLGESPTLYANVQWSTGGNNLTINTLGYSYPVYIDGSILALNSQSSGNVGIGTASPAGLLDVNGKLTVLSSGNVGIGTTNPANLLEIALPSGASQNGKGIQLTRGTGYALLTQDTSDSSNFRPSLRLKPYGDTYSLIHGMQADSWASADALRFMVTGADPTSPIGSSNRAFTFYNYSNPLMTILGGGNVGIGTTNPLSKVHIVGGDLQLGALGSSSNLIITSSSTGNTRARIDMLSDNGQFRLFDSSSSQKVTLQASGSSYLNGGNIGIGTTNPQAKLEVSGNDAWGGSSNGQIRISGATDSNMRLLLGYDTTSNFGWIQSTQAGTSYRNLILSPGGGNVGVGTTNPGSKLEIYTTSDDGGMFKLNDADSGPTNASPMAYFTRSNNQSAPTGLNAMLRLSDHSSNVPFYVETSDASAPLFIVKGDGNVGIGTTNPTATLDINAPKNNNLLKLRPSNGLVADDWVGISLAAGDTGALPNRSAQIRGYLAGGTDDVELAFLTSDSGAPTEKMRINKSGNIGIGTTNPDTRLVIRSSTGDGSAVFKSQNSSGTVKFTLYDDGDLSLSKSDNLARLDIGSGDILVGGASSSENGIIFREATNDALEDFAIKYIGSSNRLDFRTRLGGGTPISILGNNGNVGIGTTNPLYKLDVIASGTGPIARFNSANSTGCDINTDGTIVCTSDRRLKKNITDSDYGLSDIMALRPVEYNWLYQSNKARKSIGFIAQEVEEILPQLVVTNPEGRKELNTIGLIPILTKGLQEEHREVTSIKGQVTSIDENIEKLNDITLTAEEKLSLISSTLLSTEEILKQVQDDNKTITSSLETLKTQMEDLKLQNQSIIDFAAALETDRLVYKDTLGNINLLDGQLEAEGIVAGAFTIKISESKDPLFGSATIKAGENKAVITNTNVETESLINITLKSDPNGAVPFVSRQVKGEFDISIKENTASDIVINWWIMQTEK